MDKLHFDDIIDRRSEGDTTLRQVQLTQLYILQVVTRICDFYEIPYWIDFGTLLGAKRHGGFIPWDDDLDLSMTRESYWRFLEVVEGALPPNFFLQTTATDPYYDIPEVPAKIRDCKSTFIEKSSDRFHQGISIDVFPYDKSFFNPKKRKIHQRTYKNLIEGYRQNILSSKPWILDELKMRQTFLKCLYKVIPFSWMEKKVLALWKLTKEWGWRPTLSYKAEDFCFADSAVFPLGKVTFEGVEFSAPHDVESHLKTLYGEWQKLPPKEYQIPLHMDNADPFTPYKSEV